LNAANQGVELASAVGPDGSSANDDRKPLSVAVDDFLEDIKLSRNRRPTPLAGVSPHYFHIFKKDGRF